MSGRGHGRGNRGRGHARYLHSRGPYVANSRGVRREPPPEAAWQPPLPADPPPPRRELSYEEMVAMAHAQAAHQERRAREANQRTYHELYLTTPFEWWINYTETLFPRMLEGSESKLRLYGGFALNVQLGLTVPPRVLGEDNLISQYRRESDCLVQKPLILIVRSIILEGSAKRPFGV